jgi:putative MATE family efflux protein
MSQMKSQSPSIPPPAMLRPSGRDLTVGSIPRHLVLFSLPMLAGNALMVAYMFVNMFWVGNYLGTTALSVMTVTMPAFFFLVAICIGLTMSSTILISQYFGAKDMSGVRRVVGTSTVMLGAISICLMAVGEAVTPHLLRWMQTPPDVMGPAVVYMRIFLLSLPLGVGMALVRSMLQGTGDSRTPLYFQTGSVLLTALLDPVLMFGWPRQLGVPAFGLNGTAYATIISQIVTLWALVAYLRRRGNLVAPSLRLRDFDWPTSVKTVTIGLPVAVQYGLISVGMVVVTGIVTSFGETSMAAFGIASRVDGLAFMPAMAFNMAISAMAGQNIGANRPDRVRQAFWWGCILSGGITILASIVAVVLPRSLLRIFIHEQAVIDLGVPYLRIVGSSYLFFAIMFVSNGIISGSGHTLVPMIITLLSLWVIRVPGAVWLSHKLGSVEGVWYAMAGSFALSMVLSVGYYSSGLWRRGKAHPPRTMPPTSEEMFAEETAEA